MMANASAMSLPRMGKTVPIYASSDDPIVLRLSNDFDDIIGKIEHLQLTRDRKAGNRADSLIDLFDRNARGSAERGRSGADCRLNSKEAVASRCRTEEKTERDNDGSDGDGDSDESKEDSDDSKGVKRCEESEDSRDEGDESSDSDAVNHKEEHLLERGPIKSQFPSTNRESPYWTTGKKTPTLGLNESFASDYNTVEQILRDEEYSEKLNACLDQLRDAAKTVCSSWSDSKDQSASKTCNLDSNLPFGMAADDLSEDALLEILSSGLLQSAQSLSENKFLPSEDAAGSCQESHALSGSESRGSSPTCSIASAACAESPRNMRANFTCSPVASSQISTMAYRPQQHSSSSSNSPCSFSSSSNQSYGDSPSPNAPHQVPIASQLGERLDEDLENFSFWNSGPSNRHAETSKTSGNVHAVGYVMDAIDNNELQFVEEVLKSLGEEESTTMNAASFPRQECPREHSPIEQYLTRLDGMNFNVRSNCSGIAADGVNANAVKSNVSQQAYRNVPESTVPRIEATNPIPADAIVPSYSGNGSADVAQKCSWTEPENENVYDDARQSFDLPSLFPNSSFSSPSPDVAAPVDASSVQVPLERRRIRSLGSPHFQRRRHPDRSIMPWPSLNLPSVEASDRLKEGLNPKEVEKAMSSLLKRSVEELAKQDEDGDTMLMCLVGNSDELAKKKAYLVPLVERLSTVKGALSVMNDRGEDALYLAALNCPQFSYVTGYLAAAMLQKGIDVSQRLYHTRGDTLIHSIVAQGDTHSDILVELLALKTIQGHPVFDLSKRNYDGRTALHVAVESHDPSRRGISSVATVKLLLKYGADPKIKETKCGDTALHMAVYLSSDPALVKVLLATQTPDLANATNYNQNTPLHLAAAVPSSVPLDRQREVCWLLTQAGGYTNISNRQGKTPLALVSVERKDAIRRVFYRRS